MTDVSERRVRLAIVATHPIQHFCPQYRSLAARDDLDVRVFFHTLRGLEPYYDEGFGRTVQWNSELVNGFEWTHTPDPSAFKDGLAKFNPDWVWVYGYRTIAAKRAFEWLLLHPRVSCAYVSDSELRHHESVWKRRLKMTAMRMLFKRVDAVLSAGDANDEFYIAAGIDRERLVRMHYPIDLDGMRKGSDCHELRASLGISPEALVVLNVGKLVGRKRQADLVAAARRFAADEVHFVLVGSGEDAASLHDSARELDNVSFCGFVPPDRLARYYELADIYVHPSDYDPHPLAVSEAASFGCVLIVSDATGSWGADDDVRHLDNGFVVPVGDVSGLEGAIRLLLESGPTRQRMGESSAKASAAHQAAAHGGFVPDMAKLSRHKQV